MKRENIEIPSYGYSIHADWYPEDSENILLSLIGRTSSKVASGPMIGGVANKSGSNALVFDYMGHGESPFEFNEIMPAQHLLEAVKVYDWLKAKHPSKRINIFGTSYGGFLAAQLIQYRQPDKLVLVTPAIYRPIDFYTATGEQRADITIAAYRRNQKELAKHPLFQAVTTFDGAVLVLAHGRDERIPSETTDAYIRAFKADSLTVPSFTHSIDVDAVGNELVEAYQRKIADWLKA